MRKPQRLTKTREFASVRRNGKRRSDDYLVLIAKANGQTATRFGFVTSKRIGNAVRRNQIKRRLRQAALLSRVEGGWDVVVIARKDAASADFHSLRRSMQDLLGSTGVSASSRAEVDVGKVDRCSE